jgi:hypothetical protein
MGVGDASVRQQFVAAAPTRARIEQPALLPAATGIREHSSSVCHSSSIADDVAALCGVLSALPELGSTQTDSLTESADPTSTTSSW